MSRLSKTIVWMIVILAALVPLAAAASSPLLAWRQPVYIAAGFAGVAALSLLLFQPLLAGGYLPGLARQRGRAAHRWVGAGLVAAVILHVGGLWITSPPDVLDALLLRSPTRFSLWGVVAMWAVFAAAALAVFRGRFRSRLRIWRWAHTVLAVLIVTGSVIHALLIEGTMEPVTKALLCAAVGLVTLKAVKDLRSWAFRPGRQG